MHETPRTWHRIRLAALLAGVVASLACGADDAGAEGDWFDPGTDQGRGGGADAG